MTTSTASHSNPTTRLIQPPYWMAHWLTFGLIALMLTLTAGQAHAARVTALNGTVQIQRGERLWNAVIGSRLREGDKFVTSGDSEALLRFDDGARMALRADSELEMRELKLKGVAALRQKTIRMFKGGLRYISGRATVRSRVSFVTTTATIGIRGTDIEIAYSEEPVNNEPGGTYLKVNTGLATMQASDGTEVDVDVGQIAYGGLPEVVPRGPGGTRRPAARRIEPSTGGLFKGGTLDKLMR